MKPELTKVWHDELGNEYKKHTPGPWYVQHSRSIGSDSVQHIRIIGNDGSVVAETQNSTCDAAHVEGNDSLIKAAPQLYEALRSVLPLAEAWQVLGRTEASDKLLGAARIALAKAEGRDQ